MRLHPLMVLLIHLVSSQSDEDAPLLLVLGGAGDPTVGLVNLKCDKTCHHDVPPVPQPYGSPGRTGSYAGLLAKEGEDSCQVLVCGGLDDSGPPISSFKDCQQLTFSEGGRAMVWEEEGPRMANYSAHGVAAQVTSQQFLVMGGEHTRYDGPGPTQWVYHDQIQHIDLDEGTWSILPQLTPDSNSLLDSCAVYDKEMDKILVGWGHTVYGLKLSNMEWEVVVPDTGYSASRHGCTLAELGDAGTHLVVAGGSLEAGVFATSLVSGSTRQLPSMAQSRSYGPVLSLVEGQTVVVHGGNYGPSWQEGLDLGHLEEGWQTRAVEDGGRVYSPTVRLAQRFFPGCTCD